MTIAFETIRRCAEAHDAPEGMFHYTMAAAENADDTIAEGNGTEDDWDDLCMNSLVSLLGWGLMDAETDDRARKYFGAMGVVY